MKNEKTCKYIYSVEHSCTNEVSNENDYCEVHSKNISYDIEIYHEVLEMYRQDIREYFTRSNIYLLADSAVLYALFQKQLPKTKGEFGIYLGGILLGIIITGFWFFVSKGALYWLRYWRNEASRLDMMLSRFKSFKLLTEGKASKKTNFPSEITSHLPLVFLVLWIVDKTQ